MTPEDALLESQAEIRRRMFYYVDGTSFPRVAGFIPGPVVVLSAPGFWVDSLAPQPTRAEQERQENAHLRELMRRNCERLGITPERAVECLKAANVGSEYVKAWEER